MFQEEMKTQKCLVKWCLGAKSLQNLHTSFTRASKIDAMFSIMELEMEGVMLEELNVNGKKPISVWVGYWMLQGIMEAVLAFGVFVVMLFVVLGLGIDAWSFVRLGDGSGWGMHHRLVFYEVLAIAVPWFVYGCFHADRKSRLLFLLRWGVPMSMVILFSMMGSGRL